MTGESTQIKVEVEPPYLLIVFDHKCDHFLMPWQDAYIFADTLEQAVTDARSASHLHIDTVQLATEAELIQLKGVTQGMYTGVVALLYAWADRVQFSWPTALIFHKALKLQAQDAQFACKGIHFKYTQQGLIKELHNLKADSVQIIPGRE